MLHSDGKHYLKQLLVPTDSNSYLYNWIQQPPCLGFMSSAAEEEILHIYLLHGWLYHAFLHKQLYGFSYKYLCKGPKNLVVRVRVLLWNRSLKLCNSWAFCVPIFNMKTTCFMEIWRSFLGVDWASIA